MISHVVRFSKLVKEKRIRDRRNRMPVTNKVFPYYWAPEPGLGFGRNFGDELMAQTFEFLSGQSCEWNKAGMYDRTLYVGGSVIDMARDGDVVFGAGIRDFSDQIHFRKNLKVYSVRGPLSRHFLLRTGVVCPAVYGDPGILVRDLYPEFLSSNKTFSRGIVPHYSEFEKTSERFRKDPDTLVIDPRRGVREVVQDIAACNYVAASSLHGIIVAESLGIPVFWWRESEQEPIYKYYDYYLSTGRPGDPVGDLEAGFKRLESGEYVPVDFREQISQVKETFKQIEHDYLY